MQMLTIAEAAKLTERHPDTIRRLIKRLLKEDDKAQDNIKQEIVNGGFSYHVSSDYLLEHIQIPSATVEMPMQQPMQQPRHADKHTNFADGQHTPQGTSGRPDQPQRGRHTDTQANALRGQHADVQLLKETIELLKEQLTVKDKQIEQLLERGRETNILLKGYQERYLLEAPNGRKGEEEAEEKTIVVKPKRKQPQKNKAQNSETRKRKGFFSFLRRK